MFFSEDMYVKKLTEKFVDLLACATDMLIRAVKSIPDSMNEIEARKFVFTQLFSQAQIKDLSVHFDEKGSNFHTDYVLKRKPDGSYDVSFNKDVILKALKNYDTLMPDPSGVFSGPAYFLYGNRSFMNVEADEENIKKHFPSAELIKFEGVSHNIHIEDREKFLSIILDRLTQRKC
nr:uncharacterized protein LOC107454825 [Parasteatoda tepidariorum]